MMKQISIRHIFLLVLMVFLSTGCKKEQAVANDFGSNLKFVYQRLGYTKIGKEYPNQELLEIWKQNNSYSKTYQHVQNAIKELLDKIKAEPKRTLAFTLDTVCLQCDRDKHEATTIDDELECIGSMTALFFFTSDEQDKVILRRLTQATPNVLTWLSEFKYEWFYNRPNPQRWINEIEKISDNRFEQRLKETIIYRIKEAKHDSEKFGVMLESIDSTGP
jgi:hypothetical protein